MKITIKTLHNQSDNFVLDIRPDITIKELKEEIVAKHGKDFPEGTHKLIYAGKILTDESKLEDYNVEEKKFLVLMINRPPQPPKPKPDPPITTKKEPTKGAAEEQAKAAATATTTTTTSSAPVSSASVSASSSASATTTTSSTTTPNPSSRAASTARASLNSSRLDDLMSQPHFREIQDVIQQSPHLLSSTIERLSSTDPEMYDFISANPDIFVSALNRQPPLSSSGNQRYSATRTPRSATSMLEQAGPTQQELMLDDAADGITETDKEAIERLKGMGFSEIMAVQAYIACDKDEQLAANLLCQMDQ